MANGVTGQTPRALAWYGGGLAILGAAIGYFMGASQSPVVAAALPLLFGLISGAGGLYLAKADLTATVTRQKLQLFGKTLIAFVVLLMIGTFSGISQRTGIGLSTMFAGLWSGHDQTTINASQLSPLDAVRMVMLRRNLQAVGASGSEQVQILAAARIGAPMLDRTRANIILQEISTIAEKLGEDIKPFTPQPMRMADGSEGVDPAELVQATLISDVRSLSRSLARETSYFSRRIADANKDVPLQQLLDRIGHFSDMLSSLATSQEIDTWLSENAALTDKIYDLQLQLVSFKAELNNSILPVADQANTQINTFLGARADLTVLPPSGTGRALACADC